jgi:hypothetical protein
LFGADDRPWIRFTFLMMGFGVFVMVRKQLLGIRGRVERSFGLASDITVNTPEGVP